MRFSIVFTVLICLIAAGILIFILIGEKGIEQPPSVGSGSGETPLSDGTLKQTAAAGQAAVGGTAGWATSSTATDNQPTTTEHVDDGTQTETAEGKIGSGTKEGFWIAGHVKTQEGNLVPDAEITVGKTEQKTAPYGYKYYETIGTLTVRSDQDGYYETEVDSPAHYELRSHAPDNVGEYLDAFGNADLTETAKIASLDLIHRPGSGYWILGTVKAEDGQPIRNSKITVSEHTDKSSRSLRTQSDDEGNYAVKIDGPGGPNGYFLTSEPPGEYLPEYGEAHFKGDSQQVCVNFVHSAAGFLVRGQVIDKETSKPVPKAVVQLVGSIYEHETGRDSFGGAANQEGKFEIKAARGDYVVYASGKGYMPYCGLDNGESDPLARLTVNEKTSEREIVIMLRAGLAAKFVVTAVDGSPVEKASISVKAKSGPAVGVTDTNGECLIDTLSKGLAIAEIQKEGDGQAGGKQKISKAFSDPFEPGPTDNPTVVKVTLGDSASVSGRVTYEDTGEPAKGRKISLGFDQVDAAMGGSSAISGPDTDEVGNYIFENLAPGKYSVSVKRKTSYQDIATNRITLEFGQNLTGVDFAIERESDATEIVEGKVISEEDQPVPGANLLLSMFDPKDRYNRISKAARTDENGEFKITELAKADKFTLYVLANGYSTIMFQEFPMDGKYLTVTLKPTCLIGGVVIGKESRTPVQGANVSIMQGQGTVAVTDVNGQFEIKNVQPGKHRVFAEAGGYARTEGTPVELEAGESIHDVVIELEPGAQFSGILVDPEQNPVPGATVGLLSKAQRLMTGYFSTSFMPVRISGTVQSGGDGSFRVEDIALRGDTLLITHQQLADRKFLVTAEMLNQQEPIVIPMSRGGTIEGKVVDETQKPLGNVTLSIVNYPENTHIYHARTDENGEYRIEHLPPISFQVTKTSAAGRLETKRVQVQEDMVVRADFGVGEGAIIQGVVYKGGIPAPGSLITLTHVSGSDQRLFAQSGEDGAYSFRGVGEGECQIVYTTNLNQEYVTPMNSEGTARITVSRSQREYVLDLHAPSYEVVGTVRDAETNAPIPGVTIRPRSDTDLNQYRFVFRYGVETDGAGVFTFRPQEPGRYDLIAVKVEGYRSAEFSVIVDPTQGQPGELLRFPVEVRLAKADTSIELHVSYNGQPVVLGNRLFLILRNGFLYQTDSILSADQPGMYTLPGLQEGPMELMVESISGDRSLFAYPKSVTLQKGQTTRVFVTMLAVANYFVLLETSDGEPIVGDIDVEIPGVPGYSSLRAYRPPRGNPIQILVPRGNYAVRLKAPGYRMLEFIPAETAIAGNNPNQLYLTVRLERE
ncbi:MAG: carboxypeptidase regulatory-like domain-containing protein [bacterium]